MKSRALPLVLALLASLPCPAASTQDLAALRKSYAEVFRRGIYQKFLEQTLRPAQALEKQTALRGDFAALPDVVRFRKQQERRVALRSLQGLELSASMARPEGAITLGQGGEALLGWRETGSQARWELPEMAVGGYQVTLVASVTGTVSGQLRLASSYHFLEIEIAAQKPRGALVRLPAGVLQIGPGTSQLRLEVSEGLSGGVFQLQRLVLEPAPVIAPTDVQAYCAEFRAFLQKTPLDEQGLLFEKLAERRAEFVARHWYKAAATLHQLEKELNSPVSLSGPGASSATSLSAGLATPSVGVEYQSIRKVLRFNRNNAYAQWILSEPLSGDFEVLADFTATKMGGGTFLVEAFSPNEVMAGNPKAKSQSAASAQLEPTVSGNFGENFTLTKLGTISLTPEQSVLRLKATQIQGDESDAYGCELRGLLLQRQKGSAASAPTAAALTQLETETRAWLDLQIAPLLAQYLPALEALRPTLEGQELGVLEAEISRVQRSPASLFLISKLPKAKSMETPPAPPTAGDDPEKPATSFFGIDAR
ncbi:MAG: hypothetical protein AAF555_02330 [Verrucomicrobiota bacterium]